MARNRILNIVAIVRSARAFAVVFAFGADR